MLNARPVVGGGVENTPVPCELYRLLLTSPRKELCGWSSHANETVPFRIDAIFVFTNFVIYLQVLSLRFLTF
jgi:hypothetical protein